MQPVFLVKTPTCLICNIYNTSPFDRVFWVVVILTAIVCAVFIIGIEWNFHVSNYTITSVDTAHYPLWNIPFPAVTVCNFNKVQRSQAHDFINKLYVLLQNISKFSGNLKKNASVVLLITGFSVHAETSVQDIFTRPETEEEWHWQYNRLFILIFVISLISQTVHHTVQQ